MTTHAAIRQRHGERLRSYRNSAEYADYAYSIGLPALAGELPSLLGQRWEIDEETYWEFLEVLPPLAHRDGSFYLSEFTFDDITTKYTKEGDKYYCEFALFPQRSATQRPTETPWGPAQTTREIAPGITLYTTASHGGYYLSPERVAAMPKPLREFKPFTSGPGPGRWFEEDCDWAVVAVAFPQLFTADAISAAHNTLKGYMPEVYEQMMAIREAGGRGA